MGLPSSGLHSNGYSLVRQIIFKDAGLALTAKPAELSGKTLGEVLLEPTRIYVKAILPLVKAGLVKGISHITGGGLIENLPRMYGDDLKAKVDATSWPKLPIFTYLQKLGQLSEQDCYETFNMGIGLVLAVSQTDYPKVSQALSQAGEAHYQIGQLVERQANEDKISIKKSR